MKKVDFEKDTIITNIIQTALPMLVAQVFSLLYSIVDRIYIGRIEGYGTQALGAVGLCFIALGITSEKSIAVIKYSFDGDRDYNIKSGVKNALFLMYESLVGYRAQQSKLRQAQAQERAQQQSTLINGQP